MLSPAAGAEHAAPPPMRTTHPCNAGGMPCTRMGLIACHRLCAYTSHAYMHPAKHSLHGLHAARCPESKRHTRADGSAFSSAFCSCIGRWHGAHGWAAVSAWPNLPSGAMLTRQPTHTWVGRLCAGGAGGWCRQPWAGHLCPCRARAPHPRRARRTAHILHPLWQYLMRYCDNLHGGLNKLAEMLGK